MTRDSSWTASRCRGASRAVAAAFRADAVARESRARAPRELRQRMPQSTPVSAERVDAPDPVGEAAISNAPSSARCTSRMSAMRFRRPFQSRARAYGARRRTRPAVARSNRRCPGALVRACVVTSSPRNAGRPLSISYSTQPNAQMSVRRSTALPLACSGLMYAAVPRIMPASVIAGVVSAAGPGPVVARCRAPSLSRNRAPSRCRRDEA